ncbi:hypothetical protein QNH20_21445 [Neobacillus sp. WH10]|uniref:tyrosine-protein phosphatase n=1 Tax=Neobacillus sp. WH10 TaxID=3047873 RepID=UPI0024C18142|nr:CpsB/CapC family capsule biosynthesis tyrosine phosphatase [Neobacillus sp. WH10]WHY76630.1 hypothetical protein QNH20_21445 [Neobacillus sp. WH10]
MLVDIHNHILYEVDDGPKNKEEMILLAKQAVESGINHVIATPHHKLQSYENEPSTILSKVEKANKILIEHEVPLTIYPGMEFHLHENIQNDIENDNEHFLTLNNTGKYLLIELPSHFYPTHTEEVLYYLKKKGFIPILAHPERNRILRKNPAKIYELVKRGILVQITSGNFTGVYGRRLKNFSLHLLEHDLVHFIASDAHHYIRRKFELISSYRYVEKNYSPDYRKYLEENAIHALNGTDFKIMEPKIIGKRRQYFFLYNHPLNQVSQNNH